MGYRGMDYVVNRLGGTVSTDRLMRCLAFVVLVTHFNRINQPARVIVEENFIC